MGIRYRGHPGCRCDRHLETTQRSARCDESLLGELCDAVLSCSATILDIVKKALGGQMVQRCEESQLRVRCAFYYVRRWLERQVRRLLDCAHHHIIFTIPHELNILWLLNYALMPSCCSIRRATH